ncbi:carbohydrate ABC transporter permease [Paenibacillus solisilvae]|uniref:Carbohydrate ABC transporter permease n=1 Tax=Paenibacillus solisilvae TaxID=2486751 RepID=A0ABW0VY89_9BACL
MTYRLSLGRKLFLAFNYAFLVFISLLCVLPLIHILAISLSSSSASAAGAVKLWPVEFSAATYQHVLSTTQFLRSFWISIERVLLGTSINTILTLLIAYPLYKEQKDFRWRTFYVWVFVITMLFSGGLIPWYITIKTAGLLDTIGALVLPGAVPVFNVILMINFFRGLPKELEESARIDGAGHLTTLLKIFVPLSLPSLATITLFSMVGHWNSWFDGLILMNRPEHWPLQSFLQTIVIAADPRFMTEDDAQKLALVSNRTIHSAEIFVAALPILLVYPFLQRFFIKGITLGSVKG